MGNDARRQFPLAPALIAGTVAVTALVLRTQSSLLTIDMRGLLPFAVEPTADAAPKWVIVAGMPLMAALIWFLFQLGRGRAALRVVRVLYGDVPDSLADPATLDRFRSSYDSIALWIVVMFLAIHAGVVAGALEATSMAPRIMVIGIGLSLAGVGNVMPRLRPNLVAGVRTRATLTDPALWRATHRILGAGFVIAGLLTAAVGLVAPQFGIVTATATLLTALLVSVIGGQRANRVSIT